MLATEGDRLFQCGIVRKGGGENPSSFQTVSRGRIIVFFNTHCSTMNLVKEKSVIYLQHCQFSEFVNCLDGELDK